MKFVELSQKKYTYFNGTYRDEPVENPRLLQYLFEPAHLKQFYGDASDRGELSRYLVYKRPARKKVDRTIRISVNPTPDELLAMLAYAKKNCPAVKFAGPKW